MKEKVSVFLMLLICFSGFSQEAEFDLRGGEFIDSVAVANTIDETFSVYFPKSYNKDEPASVVFIFEPDARGRVGIEPFVLSASTYKYILVCSNNSRNGLPDYNKAVASRLFDHVLNNYNINIKQLYISGFSGGARLAGNIALSSGVFEGVIACGASFKPLDRFIPPANNFSYVALVGTKDMNLREMIVNKTWLSKRNIKNELFISNVGHQWPSQNEMLRAFDWLEIQAYKRNVKRVNDTVVERIYKKNLKIADSLKAAGNLIIAVNEYERMNANFPSKLVGSEIKTNIQQIRNSKIYRQEVKKELEISELEDSIAKEFSIQFDKELNNISTKSDFSFWKNQVKKLNRINFKKNDELLGEMKFRLQYKIRAMIYEAGEEFKELNEEAKYRYCQEILKILVF